MTENTAPRPDAATFDFDQWAKTGDAGRSTAEVTLYNDLTLLEHAHDIAARIAQAKAKEDTDEGEDLAMGEASELRALETEQEELEQKIDAAKMVVRITALSEGDKDKLQALHKLADRNKLGEWSSTLKGSCAVLEYSARVTNAPEGAQQLTAAQWEKISEMVAGGQWRVLTQKLSDVQYKAPRADSPFSQSGSRQRLSRAVMS